MVHTFTDLDYCVDFLTELEDENILMIVYGNSSKLVVSTVEEFDQVKSIYILCKDDDFDHMWMNNFKKVKGISKDIQKLTDALRDDIRQNDHTLIPVSIITTDDNSSSLSNNLDQSFMYTQLIKEILLDIDYTEQSKEDFINFCREKYVGNQLVLRSIDRFDVEYGMYSPIWWYSKETFVYSILNRALRAHETNLIIQMGFFLKDLHRQIEQLHKEWSNKPDFLTVYRGQVIRICDFEKLRKGRGGLISFNNFLSTSRDQDVSLCFASIEDDHREVGVFFQITVDTQVSSILFAPLETISNHDDEKEILFSMHSIFQIDEVFHIRDGLWQVNLSSTTKNDQKMQLLTDFIRRKIGDIEEDPLYRLAAVLMHMGEFIEAEQMLNKLIHLYSISSRNSDKFFELFYVLGVIKALQGHFTQAFSFFHKALQSNPHRYDNFAHIYRVIGVMHCSMGNYLTALSMQKKSLEILQRFAPHYQELLGIICGSLGDLYHRLGKPSDALLYLKKAIEKFEQSCPPDHPNLAAIYNWMGEVYRTTVNFSHALTFYEKALNIQAKFLSPNHIEMAHTLNGMGLVYKSMGKYSNSLSCLWKALHIRTNCLTPDHPDIAKTYNNIGYAFESMGNNLKALSCYQKALDIYEKFLDLYVPDLAITYSNIGTTFSSMGDYSTAIAFFEKTLHIEEKCFSDDHPTLAITYNNIAVIYKDKGDFSKALLFLEKGRQIQEKKLHPYHQDLATTYSNLAEVYEKINEYSSALSFLEKALHIEEKSCPPDYTRLAMHYSHLGTLSGSMHDYSGALLFVEKSREIAENHLHPNYPQLALLYNNIASVYRLTNDYSNSLLFFEKSRQIQEASYHSNHPDLGAIYNNIANLYDAMEDYSRALVFFEKSLSILETNFPPDDYRRVVTYQIIDSIRQKMANQSTTFSFQPHS